MPAQIVFADDMNNLCIVIPKTFLKSRSIIIDERVKPDINYYTAGFQKGFWDDDTEIIHIIGKDNLRWHALLWPAMLASVGVRLPNQIYSHGFINLNGQKISKSLGNVIRSDALVEQFGTDAVRYFFLKYWPLVDD